MNDESENREDTQRPSASLETASTQRSSTNTTFKVRDPGERPARKEKSTIQKFLPPVLGGLAALPLATAILWYGFGKDIGGIGPAVAQYAPWIVPRNLRGNGFRADGTFGSNNSGYDVGPVPDISSRKLAGDGVKSSLPSLGAAGEPLLPDPPLKKNTEVASGATLTSPAQPTPLTSPTVSNELANSTSEDAANTTSSDEVWTENTNPEKSTSPAVSKLAQSLQDLTELKEKWPTIPRERSIQMKSIADFYGSLCEIAKWSDSPDQAVSELWDQHSRSIANMILEDTKFSALTQRCASGEIATVVSLQSNDYLVTVIPNPFQPTKNGVIDGRESLEIETVIAGNPMTINFPSDNEKLIIKAKTIESGRPLLLFLRVEKHDEIFTLTAFDCMTSSL